MVKTAARQRPQCSVFYFKLFLLSSCLLVYSIEGWEDLVSEAFVVVRFIVRACKNYSNV